MKPWRATGKSHRTKSRGNIVSCALDSALSNFTCSLSCAGRSSRGLFLLKTIFEHRSTPEVQMLKLFIFLALEIQEHFRNQRVKEQKNCLWYRLVRVIFVVFQDCELSCDSTWKVVFGGKKKKENQKAVRSSKSLNSLRTAELSELWRGVQSQCPSLRFPQ